MSETTRAGRPPLVAIASRFSEKSDSWRVPTIAVGQTYCSAIARAGGIPVALTPEPGSTNCLAEVLSRFDAVVLPGGPDVDPARYGATDRHETVYTTRPEHDDLDLTLARLAVEQHIPLLAICRGLQVLNVAFGGTLHQDIGHCETGVSHRFNHHDVALEPGSITRSLMGIDRPSGHSVHHQAVDRLADGFHVTARADDGTIEGFEAADGWTVAVQWHPEDTAETDPRQQALFDGLVRAAQAL